MNQEGNQYVIHGIDPVQYPRRVDDDESHIVDSKELVNRRRTWTRKKKFSNDAEVIMNCQAFLLLDVRRGLMPPPLCILSLSNRNTIDSLLLFYSIGSIVHLSC